MNHYFALKRNPVTDVFVKIVKVRQLRIYFYTRHDCHDFLKFSAKRTILPRSHLLVKGKLYEIYFYHCVTTTSVNDIHSKLLFLEN